MILWSFTVTYKSRWWTLLHVFSVKAWTQLTYTCSKLSFEAPEYIVRILLKVNNKNTRICHWDVFLVSLLLTLNKFHTLFWCFHGWFWTGKYQLGINYPVSSYTVGISLSKKKVICFNENYLKWWKMLFISS